MPPKGAKKKPLHVLAEKFDSGTVLKDIYKKGWTIGSPIGQGGFGLIYLATRGDDMTVTNQNADYVVKIEPKDNGPLFCELHFYTNCGKEADINNFIKSYRLKHLAVPRYVASGICEYKNKEYRFLVMDRYSRDLQAVLNENSNQLNENIVLYLARQVLYALEYIHSKGYSHADIKGANLMLKNDKEVFLVDYGLAHRFSRESIHQNYVIKPEAKHNGTIEYTSRDAHDGVPPSRRGDIEILVYCMIHWLSGTLPWIDVLENKEEVHKRKIKYMKAPKEFIKLVFQNSTVSEKVKNFVEYMISLVNSLQYSDEPSYLTIQNKITDTLKGCGYSNEDNFSLTASAGKKKQQNGHASVNNGKSKSQITEPDEIIEINSDAVKTKRSRNLASEAVGSPKITVVPDSPVVKRSKIIDEDSISKTKSPKLLNRKAVIEEINGSANGFDNHYMHDENKLRTKAVLNSPAVATLAVDEQTKSTLRSSPRLVKTRVDDTPQRVKNGINYEEHEDDENGILTARKVRTPVKKTPLKRLLQPDIVKTPSSPLTRAKLTNQINENVASPLALNNLEEDDNKVLIVKRRRNVPKSTISTQTEASYLSK